MVMKQQYAHCIIFHSVTFHFCLKLTPCFTVGLYA